MPVILENEHSDSAGEKEAKRQRSEPFEYDALMGITRVGTKEAEGFEEDLDSPEYHDTIDEPTRKEENDGCKPPPRLGGIQGGFGSSSLKECIELLHATTCNTPAPLDSGISQKIAILSQFLRISPEVSLPEKNSGTFPSVFGDCSREFS